MPGRIRPSDVALLLHEPPQRVDFSNSTAATVACSATGSPEPRVIGRRHANGGRVRTEIRAPKRLAGAAALPSRGLPTRRARNHVPVRRFVAIVSRNVHVRTGERFCHVSLFLALLTLNKKGNLG
ncbi:hypothetical protein HPB52_010037 [Rhipicephalus sanguineus]|uniref:Uncharacterized protein n=1 Tax=Rhipicephalus sanguineus TaxID=34632 RepID=A0A9D4Q5E2_RHISA|nr:hypothetical protein HPB52_010037 [Rhipicephalus sanguineus]